MSRLFLTSVVASVAVASTPAHAREYLTSVASQVYQTQGTQREIALRANTCVAQKLAPGTTDSSLILSADLDSGIIVARNVTSHGSFPKFQIRSRFTFEARDGRFRIEQSNLERFDDTFGNGWGPIGKWTGSQWKSAEQAFVASASDVAQCVIDGARKADW